MNADYGALRTSYLVPGIYMIRTKASIQYKCTSTSTLLLYEHVGVDGNHSTH